jgi:hypothetical protein
MEAIEGKREKAGVELHETIHHARRIQWLRAIGNYIITSQIPTPLSHIFLFFFKRPPSQRAPRPFKCAARPKKNSGRLSCQAVTIKWSDAKMVLCSALI